MTTSSQPTSKLAAWYAATRPRVFVASFVPLGIAAVIAIDDGVFHSLYWLLSLIGVMLLQTAANLINEYADYKRGADTLKEAGQSMVIKNEVLSPEEVRNGAVASVVAGSLIGLFLLANSGPLLWVIGISGVLLAITYTAGPFPLAYHGLGEVAAGVGMGPMIVLGAYYVMQPDISAQKALELVLISLPVLFSTAAILHANNIRDLDADRSANKRTLAVRFGRDAARKEYALLWIGVYGVQVALIIAGLVPVTTLLTALTVPEARRLTHIINTETAVPPLHMAQGRTAKLHGQYGLLFCAGWLIWLLVVSLTG